MSYLFLVTHRESTRGEGGNLGSVVLRGDAGRHAGASAAVARRSRPGAHRGEVHQGENGKCLL